MRLQSFGKRVIDIMVAVTLLVILSPVIAAVAVAILMRMGRPVLFRQLRPGYKGRPFEMLKLRTMREETDAMGEPLSDDERLTRLGQWLRRTSLDELPQLWNVVRGEMSMVGPRPLLLEYLERYNSHQIRRHEAKPGITGLAQVSGRNSVPWESKFDLDIAYVDTWSLWLDIQILYRTLGLVVRGKGISAKGVQTMTRFGEDMEGPS